MHCRCVWDATGCLASGLSGSLSWSRKSILVSQQLAPRYCALLHALHAGLHDNLTSDDGTALYLSHLWHTSVPRRSAAAFCSDYRCTIDMTCTECRAAKGPGVPDSWEAV